MNIVCSTDNNFIMPCGIMLYSLCANNTDLEFNIYVIIDESVTEDSKISLKETVRPFTKCKLLFCLIDGNFFDNFPKLGNDSPKEYITKATYYRILLTEILPKDIMQCLYLDCDIVVASSLKPLQEIDIKNVAVAAVPDCAEGLIDRYNRLRYPQSMGYFNAGVLYVNLEFWRNNNIFEQMLSFIKNHSDRIKLHDQDVLNYVLYKNKTHLPIRYNLQEGYFRKIANYDIWKYESEIKEAKTNPCIIHYTDFKPWWNTCENPMVHYFKEYKQKTIWHDRPLEDKKEKWKAFKAFKYGLGCILRDIGILPKETNEVLYNI